MKVTLVGMGPGASGWLTEEARKALEQADCLVGSRRLMEQCPVPGKGHGLISTKSAEIVEYLSACGCCRPCVLYSGDTGLHSGARTLIPMLEERGISWRVIPGLSSMQYLAARLGRPWQQWQVESAHGLSCDPVGAVLAARGKPVFFLTGGAGGVGTLCEKLSQAGLGDLEVTVGEELSYPEERIYRGRASKLAGAETAPLAVLLTEGLDPVRKTVTQGMEDSDFLRDKTPMTKQEVRAAVLAKLAPREGDVCWDVGAGTGSVAVELALANPKGKVYAVERDQDACRLIRANRERFGAWNLELIQGSAPEALEALPCPDRVFVGGSGGQLSTILALAVEKNPAVRLCVTAIALETLGAAAAALTGLGIQAQVTQITAARSRPVGELNLMMGQNPVWIITGEREEGK